MGWLTHQQSESQAVYEIGLESCDAAMIIAVVEHKGLGLPTHIDASKFIAQAGNGKPIIVVGTHYDAVRMRAWTKEHKMLFAGTWLPELEHEYGFKRSYFCSPVCHLAPNDLIPMIDAFNLNGKPIPCYDDLPSEGPLRAVRHSDIVLLYSHSLGFGSQVW